MVVSCGHLAVAQTLGPPRLIITPTGANAVTCLGLFFDGGLNFNGTSRFHHGSHWRLPHSDRQLLSFVQPGSGRSANITGFLPYGVGTFQGSVLGNHQEIYRSGLLDLEIRFSVNLKGGRAMSAQELANWKQKTLLGASLTVIAPTGQYNPLHLVNWSINRWAVKPELGYSRRWGNWLLDGYAGVWFYTTNNAFFSMPNPQPQTEQPIGSFEGHLSYDFTKQRCWISVDGNFWYGGAPA